MEECYYKYSDWRVLLSPGQGARIGKANGHSDFFLVVLLGIHVPRRPDPFFGHRWNGIICRRNFPGRL